MSSVRLNVETQRWEKVMKKKNKLGKIRRLWTHFCLEHYKSTLSLQSKVFFQLKLGSERYRSYFIFKILI